MAIVRHRQDCRNFGCREVVLSKTRLEKVLAEGLPCSV